MPSLQKNFDPNGKAQYNGIFGLPPDLKEPLISILPVPWEATCSYGTGTALAPEAILHASFQVDLEDPIFGPIWEKGIRLEPTFSWLPHLAAQARAATSGTPILPNPNSLQRPPWATSGVSTHHSIVEGLSSLRTEAVRDWVFSKLKTGRPGILGGDHSCALGAFLALEKQKLPFSVLQIDAHFDLRDSFEGYQESHASVMFNLLKRCHHLVSLVQLGIRDFSNSELLLAEEDSKVHPHILPLWRRSQQKGHPFSDLLDKAFEDLHSRVWVSFDIDGLDPSLCPHTGTPVPGGFSFDEASILLEALTTKGFEILGFDLCEVSCPSNNKQPTSAWEEWDALVGARVLYKLCGILS